MVCFLIPFNRYRNSNTAAIKIYHLFIYYHHPNITLGINTNFRIISSIHLYYICNIEVLDRLVLIFLFRNMCLCDKTNESDKYISMKRNLHFLFICNITNTTTTIFSWCICCLILATLVLFER